MKKYLCTLSLRLLIIVGIVGVVYAQGMVIVVTELAEPIEAAYPAIPVPESEELAVPNIIL